MALTVARISTAVVVTAYACLSASFLFFAFRGHQLWEPPPPPGPPQLVCGNLFFESPVFYLDLAGPITVALVIALAVVAHSAGGWHLPETVLTILLLLPTMVMITYLFWLGRQFDTELITAVWWLRWAG